MSFTNKLVSVNLPEVDLPAFRGLVQAYLPTLQVPISKFTVRMVPKYNSKFIFIHTSISAGELLSLIKNMPGLDSKTKVKSRDLYCDMIKDENDALTPEQDLALEQQFRQLVKEYSMDDWS